MSGANTKCHGAENFPLRCFPRVNHDMNALPHPSRYPLALTTARWHGRLGDILCDMWWSILQSRGEGP
jgi:hypothetical protein